LLDLNHDLNHWFKSIHPDSDSLSCVAWNATLQISQTILKQIYHSKTKEEAMLQTSYSASSVFPVKAASTVI